jgi:hypothetical protein
VPAEHPLAGLISAAAAGRFPDAAGAGSGCRRGGPASRPSSHFTGHAVLVVEPGRPDRLLADLGADGLGGAHHPRLIAALAGPDGWIDSLDLLMASRGTGVPGVPPRLVARPDLAVHPRAAFASRIRDDIRLVGYPDQGRSALAVISRGIAGLTELSFELESAQRGAGGGTQLVADALTTIPADQLTMAAVAPGNAASVLALLSAGFTPLASLQLFRPNEPSAPR